MQRIPFYRGITPLPPQQLLERLQQHKVEQEREREEEEEEQEEEEETSWALALRRPTNNSNGNKRAGNPPSSFSTVRPSLTLRALFLRKKVTLEEFITQRIATGFKSAFYYLRLTQDCSHMSDSLR